jgi:hypothetical protein
MKRLLALDVATTTGYAWGNIGEQPRAEAIRFAPEGSSADVVWAKALQWLHDWLKVDRPDIVALEAPIMSSAPAGGSNPHTQLMLSGLQAVLRTVIQINLSRPAKLIHVQSARKFFIGRGNMPGEQAKREVKRRCIDLGWLPIEAKGFDRSDALCVWAKAAAEIDSNFAANLTDLAVAANKPQPADIEF